MKLTYLRGYVTDQDFSLIYNLTISDENYKIVLDILKKDIRQADRPAGRQAGRQADLIKDEYFKYILTESPKYDPLISEVKAYLNNVRAYTHDLQGYGVDLLKEKSAEMALVRNIIKNKLPAVLRRELY